MILDPTVIVHGLADAKAALAPGLPVTLLSGRGAALYGGAGWWRAMMEAAKIAFPKTPVRHFLDCADAPARALEALRLRLPGLVLDSCCRGFAEIAKAADATETVLLTNRPPALDLARPGSLRRLEVWLMTPGIEIHR